MYICKKKKVKQMNFNGLVNEIREVSRLLQDNAARAVNQHVTARNWLIGYRIFHYEQHGEDRAAYGERILENLADRLHGDGFSYRNLNLYRQFYLTFPELFHEVLSLLIFKFCNRWLQNYYRLIVKILQFCNRRLQNLMLILFKYHLKCFSISCRIVILSNYFR